MTNKEVINIDINNISEENIKYLNHVCNNDFYKNDREFIKIIKKLTVQSSEISNKALALASILDEAERIKFEMVQKELSLGLSHEEKPYGKTNKDDIINNTMFFPQISDKKDLINKFIELLESFFSLEDTNQKKINLINAKNTLDKLREYGENPKHLIINKKRAKVWFILENRFKQTMKKLDIDL